MKTLNKLSTTLLILVIPCLINSCSMIGFIIGVSFDNEKSKTGWVDKNQINQLKIGDKIQVVDYMDSIVYGKFGGLVYNYNQSFHQKHDSIIFSLVKEINLPNLNDTLLIYPKAEKNIGTLAVFRGFESGVLWYKFLYSDEIKRIELSQIDNFIVNSQFTVDSSQITNYMLTQQFSNFLCLQMSTKNQQDKLVAVSNIRALTVVNKSNAKLLGLLGGLIIDVFIIPFTYYQTGGWLF